MASRPGFLRALSSVSLIGALVLLLGIPLCAEAVCPMDGGTAIAACEELGADCCQTSGVQAPNAPVTALPPGPAIAAAIWAADTPIPSPVRGLPALEPVTAPAVIQGIGFFTLFAVFLI